ncbi:rRNA small subunit pseudouridine methyltransferase Nep1 [Nematocida minor]|uniref:rRNA small subunit pseudouridine methyltransferase Nep1 n=1 Tax=Nematocida minor TaxID=1912983 RepID=UPI00221F4F4D|nr:rRNA small subunit pseudouridine methyltransferase Nep1 [Nematocida minor]KAI5191237.1 rRNA small subunit pseudouridine methyltransferase Nep1 [Nematocida minor]
MLTVVLQNTNLEIIKTKAGKCLLSSEMVEARKRQNSTAYRPDILHQCLLMLLDSPLNKSGGLRILVETTTKKVITINPQVRIPRVYSRFTGLLIQLLERHRIYSETERTELMKVSKDPLETHLDSTSIRIGMSQNGENFFDFMKNARKTNNKQTKSRLNTPEEKDVTETDQNKHTEEEQESSYIFYINAVSSGEDPTEGMHHVLALSSYPLSAATCCSKVCTQFEELLNVF